MSTVSPINSYIHKLLGEFDVATVISLGKTFMARGAAALGSFVLVMVLGHIYGPAGVGIFALAQGAIMAAAILGRHGMDNALIRFVGRDVTASIAPAFLKYAIRRALVLSLIGGMLIFVLRNMLSDLFSAPSLSGVLIGIAIATPAYTLTFVYAGFMKAVRKPATSLLFANGAIGILVAMTVLPLQLIIFPSKGITNVGTAFAISSWLLVVIAAFICNKWIACHSSNQETRLSSEDRSRFKSSAAAFFANSMANILITVLGIWIAGYFLTNGEVGLLKAAQQVAALIGVVLVVLNAVYPPQFASLYYRGDLVGLKKIARQGSFLGLCVAIVPTVLCILFPHWVLSILGKDFEGAAFPLRILAFAQLVNASCGSVGYLLNMSAREHLTRNIAWVANITGVLLIILMTPVLGVIGAAIGIGITFIVRNFAGVFFVWTRLGIWVFKSPNVLAHFGLKGAVGLDVSDCKSIR